jgi:tetratricopeptide (TPR) repeat protein
MLLQPDSELYIIPAEGGTARRLACNLGRMNSWHTWSPDGNWLVFSSKAHSDYTQLYISRMSPQGEASPPVWLDRLVDPGRAANIPEFVALPADGIAKISERFLDDYSYTRAGNEFFRAGAVDPAIEKFRIALSMNPNNAMAHQRLGFLLFAVKGQPLEALEHLQTATRLDSANGFAHYDLGLLLVSAGDLTNAIPHLAEAVRLIPNGYDRQYNAIDMHYALGEAFYRLERYPQCITALERVLKTATNNPRANFLMAMSKAHLGETETTREYFENALKAEPGLARSPDYHELIARNYARQGQFAKGLETAQKAHQLAVTAGRSDQAARLLSLMEYCRKQK